MVGSSWRSFLVAGLIALASCHSADSFVVTSSSLLLAKGGGMQGKSRQQQRVVSRRATAAGGDEQSEDVVRALFYGLKVGVVVAKSIVENKP